MRQFTTGDLNKQVGDVTAAASRLLDLCRALSSATPDTRGLQLPYIP